MESIIEQLRVQDGKLFRDEQVMTLYVDAKRVVLDNVLLALKSPTGLDVIQQWSPELEAHILSSLTCRDANKLLKDVIQLHANLLHKQGQNFIDSKVTVLLKGMCMRLIQEPSVLNGQIQMLDPIKQDFVCREAFRRTLHADCMVPAEPMVLTEPEPLVLTQPVESVANEMHNGDEVITPNIPDVIKETETNEKLVLPKPQRDMSDSLQRSDPLLAESEIGPNDSASQIASQITFMRRPTPQVRPINASENVKEGTVVSSTSTMIAAQMKMPKNFRRVVLDDDAYTVMSSRK